MPRIVLVVLLLLSSYQVSAEEAQMGPVLADYGPTFEVRDRDRPLSDNFHYRVVFDAAEFHGALDELNPELVSVARFLNMHVRAGVPLENLDAVVVLHGEALKNALAPAAYRVRFGAENANYRLLMSLSDAGVEFVACGQSLGFRALAADDLADPVRVGLSAMTVLSELQAEGYALLP